MMAVYLSLYGSLRRITHIGNNDDNDVVEGL